MVINLVGEVHDPLNCIENGDHGGRDVRVVISGEGPVATSITLRDLWDTALIERRGLSEEQYAAFLLRDLAMRPGPRDSRDLRTWPMASHRLALDVAYHYPGFMINKPTAGVVGLDAAYVARAQTAVDR